jgi:hypothetical protein
MTIPTTFPIDRQLTGQSQAADIAATATTRGILWPLMLMWLAALLPPQVRITLGGFDLYSYRLCFVFLLPWVVGNFTSGRLRIEGADRLLLASSGWMIVSMIYNEGLAVGFTRSLSVVIDIHAGYFVARSVIRSTDDMRRVLVAMSLPFLAAGSVVMIESLTHKLLLLPLFDAYFGAVESVGIGGTALSDYAPRFGLFRGVGAFPHPILAGLCLATLLPLYATARLRSWPHSSGLIAGFQSLFSMSSTGFLGISLCIVLLTYDRVSRWITGVSWRVFFIVGGLLATIAQFLAGGGVVGLAVRFSFDGNTAYYRYIVWQYATQALAGSPLFGIGDRTFSRPAWMISDSVDSYWLLLALRYGYLAPLLLLACCVLVIARLALASARSMAVDRDILRGIAISLSIMVVGGFAVALFSGSQVWFAILLGCGVNCAEFARRKVA